VTINGEDFVILCCTVVIRVRTDGRTRVH